MPTIRAAWGLVWHAVTLPRPRVRFPSVADVLRPTLGDLAVGRENNLNLLRFVAASIVLFSHCYALTGHIADEPVAKVTNGLTDIATIGVTIFFAISGFLVTQSVMRSRSMGTFIKARALRLLPALALSTAFCVFVLGPIATKLPQNAYWTDQQTWRYLIQTALLDPQLGLPGVFRDNPYPLPAVNGSLWTIPLEVWCYVAIGIATALGIARRQWAFSLLLGVGFVCFVVGETMVRRYLPSGQVYTAPYLIAIFFVGGWCFLYRAMVPITPWLAGAIAIIALLLLKSSLALYAFYLGVAYLAYYCAYSPTLRVKWFLRVGDYSYGIYVFAFPVQQFLVWQFRIADPWVLLATAYPATLALAVISWHLVEQPALALKR